VILEPVEGASHDRIKRDVDHRTCAEPFIELVHRGEATGGLCARFPAAEQHASSAASVPRVGTLSVDRTGRPTLELVGYVRIPITRTGTYTWTSRLIAAPPSVMSLGGNPDAGSDGHRVDGSAVVSDFKSRWIGTFPKGNIIGERVTFRVVSFRGKPFVELLGGSIGGAPRTTSTTSF
jgi:hypothetical protein